MLDDELLPQLHHMLPPKISQPSKTLKSKLGGEQAARKFFEELFLALVSDQKQDAVALAQQLRPAVFKKATAAVKQLLQRIGEAAEATAEYLGNVRATFLGFSTKDASSGSREHFLVFAERLPNKKESYEDHFEEVYALSEERAVVCVAFPYAGISSSCELHWTSEQQLAFRTAVRFPLPPIVDIDLRDARRLLQLKEEAIGADVSRKDVLTTISQWCSKHRKHKNPMQVFLHERRSPELPSALVTADERKEIRKLTAKSGVPLFIHAPYQLSLTKEDSPKHAILAQNLQWGAEMQARGVVIHTDSWKWFGTEQEGEEAFLAGVVKMAAQASPACPLLIETPAKQGKDLLACLRKFTAFYQHLSRTTNLNTGICVDTCHLFAAGYRPLEYIVKLSEALPDTIKLIHFNGSLSPFGSRVDRHASDWTHQAVSVREGAPLSTHQPKNLLPLSWLLEVAEWAVKHSVPMVTERG